MVLLVVLLYDCCFNCIGAFGVFYYFHFTLLREDGVWSIAAWTVLKEVRCCFGLGLLLLEQIKVLHWC